MRGPHPRPSDYDPRLIPLDDVIMRAMKLDPRERQQDAADLARALRAFLQGTDVTDIARELGDRVRDLRAAASNPMPMANDGEFREPAASASDMGTKTFASREEAIRWSRSSAFEIEEPPGASTRRLSESMPPPSELPADLAAMLEPTPLAETPVSMVDAAASPPDPDTLATRPLETPVKVDSAARWAPASSRSRTWGLAALAAVACTVGVGVAWRAKSIAGRLEGSTTPTSSVMAASSATAAKIASAIGLTAVPTASSPTAIALSPPSGAPSGGQGVAPSSASAMPDKREKGERGEKGGRATVSFLGDPGTHVAVDGSSRGSTPVRVSLEPGPHDVRFHFDPTGESRGERFTVKPNERVTVRADFTGATPTVRIQR
jgi:hypothetical protein